jgi:hypothetical protein
MPLAQGAVIVGFGPDRYAPLSRSLAGADVDGSPTGAGRGTADNQLKELRVITARLSSPSILVN